MTNWIHNCQICNDGLCIRMKELKKEGHSERKAAEIMHQEAAEQFPELVEDFAAEKIRNRYKYHMKKVGEIHPPKIWPLCKKCGENPAKEKWKLPHEPGPATPEDHGLCSKCFREKHKEQSPECKTCRTKITGRVYSHGLCKYCRKKELREEHGADAYKRLDERQQEIDQTPIDIEADRFWGNYFTFSLPERAPTGKVTSETLNKLEDTRSDLFSLIKIIDEVIEQSEVSVRVK